MKDIKSKNEMLDQHLKNVYVKSHDAEIEKQNVTSLDRPLPLNRQIIEDFEYGFKEPNNIPPGRITLKKALKFINDYQTDPKTYTVNKLSDDYLLSEETVSEYIIPLKCYCFNTI